MKKNNKKITLDDLAGMMKRGFDELGNKLSGQISNLDEKNERAHEEIKLRLDNVAYRFELVELQKRVEILENKIGIKKASSA